jgi:hypothetical protein
MAWGLIIVQRLFMMYVGKILQMPVFLIAYFG